MASKLLAHTLQEYVIVQMEGNMSRKALVVLCLLIVISLGLFAINKWLYKEDEGIFLTQNTYLGTVTWYEDRNTPPIPEEFSQRAPLLATNGEVQPTAAQKHPVSNEQLVDEIESVQPVFELPSAAGPEEIPTKNPPVAVVQQKVPPMPSATVQKETGKTVRQKAIDDIVTEVPKENALEKIVLLNNSKKPVGIFATAPVTYKAFYLTAPERIVIDVYGKLQIPDARKLILPGNSYTKSTRVAYNNDNTRIVIDLQKKPQIWSVSYGKTKNILEVELR